jgi:hypothetical protein
METQVGGGKLKHLGASNNSRIPSGRGKAIGTTNKALKQGRPGYIGAFDNIDHATRHRCQNNQR